MPARKNALPEPLLKSAEVAEYLQISLPVLYAMVRDGTIPVVKLGSRVLRFSRPAIMRFVEKGTWDAST